MILIFADIFPIHDMTKFPCGLNFGSNWGRIFLFWQPECYWWLPVTLFSAVLSLISMVDCEHIFSLYILYVILSLGPWLFCNPMAVLDSKIKGQTFYCNPVKGLADRHFNLMGRGSVRGIYEDILYLHATFRHRCLPCLTDCQRSVAEPQSVLKQDMHVMFLCCVIDIRVW